MRPRPDAAENVLMSAGPSTGNAASMRPRPDAAENFRLASVTSPSSTRFNEAAARCRGKPARSVVEITATDWASMRPRPDAAENAQRGRTPRSCACVLQ